MHPETSFSPILTDELLRYLDLQVWRFCDDDRQTDKTITLPLAHVHGVMNNTSDHVRVLLNGIERCR